MATISEENIEKYKQLVTKKTNEWYQLGKYHVVLNAAQVERDKLYAQLGKLTYSNRSMTKDVSDEKQQLIQDITKQLADIKRIEAKLATIKGEQLCPSCQRYISTQSTYCPFCSKRLP